MTTNNFTLQQIKDRHAQVRSGADFPAYIHDLKQMGVTSYTTYVSDGHTDYQGAGGYMIASPAKYDSKTIAPQSKKEQFQKILKEHQQGKSDYATFCTLCAELGVEKWMVDMQAMTCTYYDAEKKELLVEAIPV